MTVLSISLPLRFKKNLVIIFFAIVIVVNMTVVNSIHSARIEVEKLKLILFDFEGDQSIYGELQTEYISGCQDCLISPLCTI